MTDHSSLFNCGKCKRPLSPAWQVHDRYKLFPSLHTPPKHAAMMDELEFCSAQCAEAFSAELAKGSEA